MAIRRREFIAGLSGFGIGLGIGGVSHWLPLGPAEIGPDWAPGREEFVCSTCTLCPSHCGIRGRLVDGKLVRIEGNPLHPISRGGLCPKGAAGIQLLYHPGRLTGPVQRVGPRGSGEFQSISWDEALTRVADALGELMVSGRAESVAWLTGDLTGITDELLRRFTRVCGSSRLMWDDYADGAAEVMELCQGVHSPPAFDLAASDYVLSFGAGLSEAWWCLPQAAGARDAVAGRRPRFVQVDVRHSRTAGRADEWIPVKPGTYGALALGIAYIMLKEGLYSAEQLRDTAVGIEDWTDPNGNVVPGFRSLVLRHGRTEDVARRTGLREETLVRLAKAFGTASRPVAVWDQSVSWRTGGLSDSMAIHTLNILAGALGRPGGVLVQPPLPGPPIEPRQDSNATARAVAPKPGDWASLAVSESPSPVDVLFMYYANPIASAADAASVHHALERIPLVVSFSPFLDESAAWADLVLPDHVYLERWQDAPAPPSVPIPVWGVVQPMVPPLHDTRATGDVILDLASRLGGDVAEALPWSGVEQLVEERGKALTQAKQGGVLDQLLRREELRELESRGYWLPHGKSESKFWASILERGGWFDPYYDYDDRSVLSRFPDAKVRVFSDRARETIRLSEAGLAEGFLPLVQDPVGEQGEQTAYPLLLIPFRVMTLSSGNTPLMPWLLEHLGVQTGAAWEVWAEINPETAKHLGLTSGQRVRIESGAGAFEARLTCFDGAQPGVVNVPYGLHTTVEGWGGIETANPLHAVGNARDPSTGLPDWYSTRVRVAAV